MGEVFTMGSLARYNFSDATVSCSSYVRVTAIFNALHINASHTRLCSKKSNALAQCAVKRFLVAIAAVVFGIAILVITYYKLI